MAGVRIGGSSVAGIGFPYSKFQGSTFGIFYVPLAGGSPVGLTTPTADEQSTPVVSPDGQKCVYLLGDPGIATLHIINVGGTGDTEIDPSFDRFPDWKPDGSKILFCTFDSGDEHKVFTIDPDGSNRTAIYTGTPGNFLSRAIYNRNGTKIAFLDQTAEEVWVMDADGSNAAKVDDLISDTADNAISWANGSDVLAYGDGGVNGDWLKINADGTGRTVLGTQVGSARANLSRRAWVPNDSVLYAMEWTADNRWSLVVLQADGSGQALASPVLKLVDIPVFVYGSRVYALPYIDPAPSSGCDMESVALDASDRRVEDPADCDDILFERDD